jgi:hypothetical protein
MLLPESTQMLSKRIRCCPLLAMCAFVMGFGSGVPGAEENFHRTTGTSGQQYFVWIGSIRNNASTQYQVIKCNHLNITTVTTDLPQSPGS